MIRMKKNVIFGVAAFAIVLIVVVRITLSTKKSPDFSFNLDVETDEEPFQNIDGQIASQDDQIRPLPDTRPRDCKAADFLTEQNAYINSRKPTVAIVMTVKKGMHYTVVERAIKTVIQRSPLNLIKHILVIHGDDIPTKVIETVKKMNNHLVNIKSYSSSLTWMQMRLMCVTDGSLPITDFIVYLDADIECNERWLQPLLSHVARSPHHIVVPHTDSIDTSNFEYASITDQLRVVFDWNLMPRWYDIDFEELLMRRYETDVTSTPLFGGTLFVISREFMLEIIDVFGLSHPITSIEVSFYTWMCATDGAIYILPCSRVGKLTPYELEQSYDSKHVKAIAESWLGQHAKQFYAVSAHAVTLQLDDSTSAEIIKLRKVQADKQCKSFDEFIRSNGKDLHIPADGAVAFGHLRSRGGSTCFQVGIDARVLSSPCNVNGKFRTFDYLASGHIKNGDKCVTAPAPGYVTMDACDWQDARQQWVEGDNGQIWLRSSSEQTCLMHATDPDPEKHERQIIMAHICATKDGPNSIMYPFQQWDFTYRLANKPQAPAPVVESNNGTDEPVIAEQTIQPKTTTTTSTETPNAMELETKHQTAQNTSDLPQTKTLVKPNSKNKVLKKNQFV